MTFFIAITSRKQVCYQKKNKKNSMAPVHSYYYDWHQFNGQYFLCYVKEVEPELR